MSQSITNRTAANKARAHVARLDSHFRRKAVWLQAEDFRAENPPPVDNRTDEEKLIDQCKAVARRYEDEVESVGQLMSKILTVYGGRSMPLTLMMEILGDEYTIADNNWMVPDKNTYTLGGDNGL